MIKENFLLNTALPMTMHIDLNSCFAIIEQQANRLLRGRPVGVAAYDTPRGFVIAASYEAKAKRVKLGVNVQQSRSLAPGIIIMTPDPAKYREAHRLFKELMLEYTPDVVPKSIDEFVLDMSKSIILKNKVQEIMNKGVAAPSQASNSKHQISDLERQLHNKAMLDIGNDMKAKIKERLGEWVTVNIGIAPNRFLAKYAAGFGKPDGMMLIDHTNVRAMYEGVTLVDLPGINTRFRARLRQVGIYTPLEFLEADMNTLTKRVFKSINGYHWYMKLRGYETEDYQTQRRSIGHQVALSDKTRDLSKLERLLMKLSEKTGRRLRKNNLYATGIHLHLSFDVYHDAVRTHDQPVKEAGGFNLHNFRKWSHGEKVAHRLYSTADIYDAAKRLLYQADIPLNVKVLSITVFGLEDWDPVQMSLFEQNDDWGREIGDSNYRSYEAGKRVSDAVDAINNRYGEFIVTPATMLDMSGEILDRIAFGQIRDM